MPPFVHQAAPSRFVNSPYHTTAAAWSSTASSTPVFKRWCPWDRSSGQESSVAATMAKRPRLFTIQVLLPLVGTASTTSTILPATVLLCTKGRSLIPVNASVHQAAPSRFVNSPYHTTAVAWSSTTSSTPAFKRWCPWDRSSAHESSVAATMAKRLPLFAIQVLLPLLGTASTTSAILPVTVLLCTKGRSLLPVNASVRSSGGALKISEQPLSLHDCSIINIYSKFNASI
ncbi:hypothetical protein V5799_023914 [Amblyomma americanum]|uniref:Uncharacterized protein n=1 Tax=Amblyomma americanum TaxID=6943 RepID=A0AAQ4FHP2_AMBAM